MSHDFPDRWKFVPLRSMTSKIGSGATPRGGERAYKRSGIPLIRSMNVHCDGFRVDGLAYLDEEQAAALSGVTVHAGDVLLNITGASIGRVTQAPQEMDGARVNQHVCIIRPVKGLDPSFVARYLASPSIQAFIAGENYGVTRQALTKEMIENISVPVPLLIEQRLIVARLDNLFARSERGRKELSRIPRLAERYKQAILSAAFSGRMAGNRSTKHTADRSVEGPARRYKRTTLEDICDQKRTITYGVIKLGAEVPNGIPCLRTSNVRWLQIDTDGMKKISPILSMEYGRTILQGGEVLVNVRGTLGGVAVAAPSMKGWNVSREIAVVPVDTAKADSDYLAYWIGSDSSQLWLRRVQKGVAYTGINLSDLRKLPVDLPSIEDQREIVQYIRSAHSRASALGDEVDRARALVDRLDQATLAKAFRGELVAAEQLDRVGQRVAEQSEHKIAI